MIDIPAAIRQLAFENVTHAPTLQLRIYFAAPVHEEHIIRAESSIDNQYAAPMAIRYLLAQQIVLCPRDYLRNLAVFGQVVLGYFRSRAWQDYELSGRFRHLRLLRRLRSWFCTLAGNMPVS